MSVIEDMRLSFIKQSKRDLKKITYPQPFCTKLYEYTNCMAYAIGLQQPDYGYKFYFPGGMNGEYYFLIPELILPRIIIDLEILGITATIISKQEASYRTHAGQQIVALFYSESQKDFHFIRKDKEGGWSHKLGYELPPQKISYNYEEVFNSTYNLLAYLSLSFT